MRVLRRSKEGPIPHSANLVDRNRYPRFALSVTAIFSIRFSFISPRRWELPCSIRSLHRQVITLYNGTANGG